MKADHKLVELTHTRYTRIHNVCLAAAFACAVAFDVAGPSLRALLLLITGVAVLLSVFVYLWRVYDYGNEDKKAHK